MYRARDLVYFPATSNGVTERDLAKTVPHEVGKAVIECDWRALANQLRNEKSVTVRIEVHVRIGE